MGIARETYIPSEPSKVVAIYPSGNREEGLDVVQKLRRDIGEGGRNPISHRDGSVVEIANVGKPRTSSGIIAIRVLFWALFVRDNDLVVVLGHDGRIDPESSKVLRVQLPNTYRVYWKLKDRMKS